MVRESERENRDVFDTMDENLTDSPGDNGMRSRRQGVGSSEVRSGSNLIFWVLGLVILILLIALLLKGGSKPSAADVNALNGRIDQLEKKLSGLDTLDKKITSLDRQLQTFQQSFTRLEGADRSLKEKMDKMAQDLEKAPPPPPVKASQGPSNQKTPAIQGKGRFHEVLPRETLFQIARKYNLTVDQLRQFNHLSKDQKSIQPGQKLLVAPE